MSIAEITRFNRKSLQWLVMANIAMLAIIAVHDADHIRQAANWCYRIPSQLLLINMMVYAPNLIALLLTWRRHRLCALGTAIGSTCIVTLFLKIHLWKSDLAIWSIWNRSFFELEVDWISWCILAALAGIGAAVCALGILVEMRSSYEHPAIPW